MVDCQASLGLLVEAVSKLHSSFLWWLLACRYVRKLGNPLQDHRFDPAIGAVLGRCHLRAPWQSRMETLGNPWKPETGNPNPQPGHQRCRSTTPSCCKLHCCTGFTGTCSEPKKLHGLAGTGCCREASGCMVKYCNQSVRSKEFLARFRKEHEKETTFFPILSRRSHTLDLPSKTRSTGSCIQYLLRIACWQVLISSQVSFSDPNDVLLYDLEVSWSGLLVTEVPTPKKQNMVGYLQ